MEEISIGEVVERCSGLFLTLRIVCVCPWIPLVFFLCLSFWVPMIYPFVTLAGIDGKV